MNIYDKYAATWIERAREVNVPGSDSDKVRARVEESKKESEEIGKSRELRRQERMKHTTPKDTFHERVPDSDVEKDGMVGSGDIQNIIGKSTKALKPQYAADNSRLALSRHLKETGDKPISQPLPKSNIGLRRGSDQNFGNSKSVPWNGYMVSTGSIYDQYSKLAEQDRVEITEKPTASAFKEVATGMKTLSDTRAGKATNSKAQIKNLNPRFLPKEKKSSIYDMYEKIALTIAQPPVPTAPKVPNKFQNYTGAPPTQQEVDVHRKHMKANPYESVGQTSARRAGK